MDLRDTFLGVFFDHVARSDVKEKHAVECGDEWWTYDDLDSVSTGLAVGMKAAYGARPTVAIFAENLPYTFALILAVWKLHGIVAPIDYHTPENLVKPMLQKIAPSCVVVPSAEKRIHQVALELGFPLHIFHPKNTTMTALCQQFIQLPDIRFPEFPDATSIAIYLFTSSASDISNIKAVPLTHYSLISQSRSFVAWLKKAYPAVSFSHVRYLGWGPFSHMIAMSYDLGGTILSGGCYIFGLLPSSYFIPGTRDDSSRPQDIMASLLDAMLKFRPDFFSGVPWVLEGLMKFLDSGIDSKHRKELVDALRGLKVFHLGGAPTSTECIRWAQEHQVALAIGIGMTELGGGLFHKVADEVDGWHIEDVNIADAELVLIGEDGNPHESEGELTVSSKFIAQGYLDHDSSNFTIGSDGRITFRTGDLYSKSPQGYYRWLGRKDDFIQLVSGENVDPRVLEKSLNKFPSIAQSCIIGNNFLSGSAQFLCALVELNRDSARMDSTNMDISRAIRSINRSLPPQLRIGWSHVIVLEAGLHIPFTRKGLIFRKKLEALFGDRVTSQLNSLNSDVPDGESQNLPERNPQRSQDDVREIVLDIIADTLRLSRNTLESESDSTFSELGMDSAAATAIVSKLNLRLDINLPRNACHTHVDLVSLITAIWEKLRLVETEEPTMAPRLICDIDDHPRSDDIVVVGQALRLPGGSLDLETVESFWEALVTMREDLMVPPKRWDHSSFYRPPGEPATAGDITFAKAGFVEIENFDNNFFGISSAEALSIAPPIRLALETTFTALENANIPISQLKGTDTGIFVANGIDSGYDQLLFASQEFNCYSRFYGTGVASSTSCGRLSYLLDIHGPSVSIDTACSGGMVALDQAYKYLRSGQAETAIVCGVNTHAWPGAYGFISAQKMSSPTSRCSTFAENADGYVPSEGAVSLILKTRSAAHRDKDNILAIIKSTGTRHNGKSQGLVAPSASAQATLQSSLLSAAAVTPSDIDFIETHGTGTTLGDQIEMEAISSVFRSSHTSTRPLLIGAAKTCVGHTEATAGLVGVVKAIKQLAEGKVAGLSSLKNGRLNPEIDTSLVPIHIPSSLTDIIPQREGPATPLRALVVAYGFAGTISGTVLEAPTVEKSETREPEGEPTWMIFSLSAKSRDALLKYLHIYLDFCLQAPPETFRSICYTSCVGRELYRHRFICVVKDLDGLVQRLRDQISRGRFSAPYPVNSRTIFAFPGQGSQYYGMANALAKTFPVFRQILTDAANAATSDAGFDVLRYLVGDDQDLDRDTINESAVSQICIYVYQYCVCQFLRRIGIVPDALLGNSLGEISAAVEAGALSYELGLQFAVARAKILAADPDCPAGMAAIAASEPTILQSIQNLHISDRVVIAVFSGMNNHVVSGELGAVNVLVEHFKKIGVRATLLNVDQGFHSPCIAKVLPRLEEWIQERTQDFRPLRLPLFSATMGKLLATQESLHPQYWIDHARDPVQFQKAAEAINKSFKNVCVLDIGPTPTAWAALQTNDLPDTLTIASSTKKGKDQELAFLTAIAHLIEIGRNPDFHVLFGTRIPKMAIPTYPFQRQRHYPDLIPSRNAPPAVKSREAGRFVADLDLYELLDDHRIHEDRVLPAAAMVDFFARREVNKSMDVRFHRPMVLHSPGRSFHTEFTDANTFAMHDGLSTATDQLCSGTFLNQERPPTLLSPASFGPEEWSLIGDEVYNDFKGNGVQFGPAFKNIVSIKFWDDHADGSIVVPPSVIPELDRIRALDACIHMLGACRLAPPTELSGSFLPVALEGYSMNVEALPSSFICRYRLPVVMERRNQLASTAFEVLSLSGELLASCTKYSVAWVHLGDSEGSANSEGGSLQQEWIPRELGPIEAQIELQKGKVAFFGRGFDGISLAESAFAETYFFEFHDDLGWRYKKLEFGANSRPEWCNLSLSRGLFEVLGIGRNTTIILDATFVDGPPDSPPFSSFWRQVLELMKALATSIDRTFEFAVVSAGGPTSAGLPTCGVMVQGMLRVFRRELGLERVWGLELPGDTPPNEISKILNIELAARRNATCKDTMVAYRHSLPLSDSNDVRLVRAIPELHRVHRDTSLTRLSGVTVIVGMGSVGLALASQMISAGSSTIVFIGRRASTNTEVVEQLSKFSSIPGRVMYLQADVCDKAAVRRVLQDVTAARGAIRHIVHTAAVVADATIASVTTDSFDRVLRPKVIGAYNLHLLSAELELELDSFVLFSSISVPLGNLGQVAYVAANAFLDSLATYRRSIGLPGVSIQLGPWESKLLANLPSSSNLLSTMSHEEGLPLIMNALSSSVPIQVVANLNTHALSQIPVFAQDPLFAVLVADAATPRRAPNRGVDAVDAVTSIVRAELELLDSDPLDLDESLTASGIDSIAFNHIRGKVLKELGVDVPMVFLSDAFSLNDMIKNVQDTVSKEA